MRRAYLTNRAVYLGRDHSLCTGRRPKSSAGAEAPREWQLSPCNLNTAIHGVSRVRCQRDLFAYGERTCGEPAS